MERYDLTYKYSKDNGLTFIDITEIVNSAQTSIVHNICSAGFKSATDTASFTIPAKDTALKQNLINALLDGSTVLVRILEGDNVIFTGYVNKDNISIRSYPLTASITIEVEDVGTLNLDNKVNEYVYYKNYTITELVHALLTKAGYTYDNSSLATGDEQTLEAFVIDKDNSNTFREYIDTLLFEAGGYVLDFNAQGIASIVKLNWQATGDATLVDNPMDSEGITTKTKILDVDGVSLTWASTKWSDDNNQLLWQDSISRKLEDNYVVGEDVENQHYWPADGELNPIYQEYNSELLDTDYLTNASRKQNEDLAIIVAEDIRAEIQATKNKAEFTSWEYPLIQDFIDNYDLTINPIAYPKKAWYLLYNDSGETVNIQHFRLYGKVFYKDKKHTLKTKETKNPKEYESQYIYNETHANQFLQFYWHFMQTSRISVTWKEVGANHTLGDVVQVYHKGSLSYVKAIVAGITTTFIGKTKITSYSAVGVASQIIPYPTLSITKLRGSTQAENRGIDNVKVQYATSITQTGTKTSYQDVMPTLHPYTAKYLWQKETIYYTDGTKDVFEDIIAVYGDKGDAGDGITAQYCYSTSPTECTGGTLVWNDADIYWGEEQGVWNWWTTQTLEEEDGLYIWLRTKIGNGEWVYTRLTGVQAKVCTISCDKSAVIRNDRLTTKETYTFKVTVQGYLYTELRLTINNYDYELVDNECAFEMPYLNASAITANLYMDDVLMDTITLSVVDETQQAYYIGVSEADPVASAYGTLLIGDWYLDKTTNVVKIYNGETWDDLDNSAFDTSENLQKVSVCMADMIKIGTTNKTTATLLGVFKYLCADEAFIKQLYSNDISSTNFQEDSNGYYATKGFRLQAENKLRPELNGLIRSADARFYNVDIKGGNIEDVSISKRTSAEKKVIFKTQDLVPSILFSATNLTGTHIINTDLTGGKCGTKDLTRISGIQWWWLYKDTDETSDYFEYRVYNFSFTAGFTGTYIFYPAMASTYSEVDSARRMDITVDGVKHTVINTTSENLQSIEVSVTKGQSVSVGFGFYFLYYKKAEILAMYLAGRGGEIPPRIAIKDYYDEHLGKTVTFKTTQKYWVTQEYISANDLYIRSPILTEEESVYFLATTLNSMGITVKNGDSYVNPTTIAYYVATANQSAYNLFSSLSLGEVVRLSSTITVTCKNVSYTVTRLKREESNIIFLDDNGSVLSIAKDNHLCFSIPACNTLVLHEGVVSPNIYTTGQGQGQVGTQDNPFGNAWINNLTGNVNAEGTDHKVYGAVFN